MKKYRDFLTNKSHLQSHSIGRILGAFFTYQSNLKSHSIGRNIRIISFRIKSFDNKMSLNHWSTPLYENPLCHKNDISKSHCMMHQNDKDNLLVKYILAECLKCPQCNAIYYKWKLYSMEWLTEWVIPLCTQIFM